MSFDENAGLDTSQVEDSRGFGGIPGGGIAIGGGAGLILAILGLLFGGNLLGGGGGAPAPSDNGAISQSCRSGADANAKADCRVVATVNSVQAYWKAEFTRRGWTYRPAKTRIFSQATSTGCGTATSEVGPFYCPADEHVYIDVGFFTDLQQRFGARGGPFAQEYVIAHEYGHHVQDLVGTTKRVAGSSHGAESASVRLELQADCLAGVWAHHATETRDSNGHQLLEPLTEANIADALDAASTIGDDRIQQKFQGRVDRESWTHGSSEQRQHWFSTGYQTGAYDQCDTFSGPI